MKKIFLLITFFVTISCITFSQKTIIKGKITDPQTGETLIGANVLLKEGVGTSTDIDGNYTIVADNGEYNLQISYVGYKTIQKKITASGKTIVQNFSLETVTLNEISVVADVARSRQTPVAYTNVLPTKIEEELASRDIPMILNSTPGVYATQQGGGDGDARITIRGFNQQNVAVMIDGIPVNDMENGWVYWSNWFGLDAVTRSIQVQRGLGSSKLAIPSVGGTMNIITKGIESKKGIVFKEEVDADGKFRTSLGLTSGKLKNGWGFTLAGSYKRGNGWVDNTWTRGWFYYLKVDKSIKNHIITLSAMGAPQMHGQRKYKKPIATFDKKYAESLGVDSFPKFSNMGTDYNAHWGWLDRYTYDDNGSIVHEKKEKLNEAVNYYHKPQFSLRDFWNVNDKLYISNIAYLSVGNGGGTAVDNTLKDNNLDNSGQINWQPFYDNNITYFDLAYSRTETKSTNWINSNVNNHFWYGLLTTLNYKLLKDLTLSGGIDLRSYKGEHYVQLYDLLGGDYVIDSKDVNRKSNVYHEGDIINRHYDGLVFF